MFRQAELELLALGAAQKMSRRRKLVYWFKDEISGSQFFWFDKNWILDGIWPSLPKASKAILPILLSFKDGQWHFPSALYIASLAGLAPKTVGRGFDGLHDFPGLHIKKYRTSKGFLSRRWKFTPGKTDRRFPFYEGIVSRGNWFQLSSSSKALYPVMRSAAKYFDGDAYEYEIGQIEELVDGCGIYNWSTEFDEAFASRKFDFSTKTASQLCKFAGIDRSTFYPAIADLEKNSLVKKTESSGYLVFLQPLHYAKPSTMNKKVHKKLSRYYGKYRK